jgi:hypothetical protein
MSTFRNTVSVPSSQMGRYEEFLLTYLPTKMEWTQCSKMLVYKLQMPANHPEESIQDSEHNKSLKSRFKIFISTLVIMSDLT